MKKIAILSFFYLVIVFIVISVPNFTVTERDFNAIIGRKISSESFKELYIEKESLYYPAKKIIVRNDNKIKEVFEYFKSFKYCLSSQKEFLVKDEPFTFIFRSHENSFDIKVFVYNKTSISIRTKNGNEEYNIKGDREFDYEYFKEFLSEDQQI